MQWGEELEKRGKGEGKGGTERGGEGKGGEGRRREINVRLMADQRCCYMTMLDTSVRSKVISYTPVFSCCYPARPARRSRGSAYETQYQS